VTIVEFVLTLLGAVVSGVGCSLLTIRYAYPVLARRWPDVYGPHLPPERRR
jgi:hypothetical protein